MLGSLLARLTALLSLALAMPAQVTLIDLRAGPGSSSPVGFVELLGVAIFWADDGIHGTELWRSDGTPAGTRMLADLTPGALSTGRLPLTVAGRKAFFVFANAVQGEELWATDGTEAGTRIVRDMLPNHESTSPTGLTAVGTRLFFSGRTVGVGGRELHVSDGTFAGTRIVADIRPGTAGANPGLFTVLGDRLYFLADDGVHGQEIWGSDGSDAGTRLVADLIPGGSNRSISGLTATGGRLWFGISPGYWYQGNPEIWTSDGSAAGTRLVAAIPLAQFATMLRARWFVQAGNGCLFGMSASQGGWTGVTDGTAAGTFELFVSADSTRAFLWRDVLYFAGYTTATGSELWRSDGTVAGTHIVVDAAPGPVSAMPLQFAPVGSQLVFEAQGETGPNRLRATDGTAAGTTTLAAAMGYSAWTALGSRLIYFQVTGNPSQLWRTDGTPLGTQQVASPGRWTEIEAVGGQLFFDSLDPIAGTELGCFLAGAIAQRLGPDCPSGIRVPRLECTDPVLGGNMDVVASNLTVGSVFALLLGARTPPVGIGACDLQVDLLQTVIVGPLPTVQGRGQLQLALPGTSALIGQRLGAQSIAAPGNGAFGVDLTNAVLLQLGL